MHGWAAVAKRQTLGEAKMTWKAFGIRIEEDAQPGIRGALQPARPHRPPSFARYYRRLAE